MPGLKGKFAVRDCHWHVNEGKPEQMLLGPILEWVRTAQEVADSATAPVQLYRVAFAGSQYSHGAAMRQIEKWW